MKIIMKKIYKTKGTCSRQIIVDVNDDKIISNVEFVGGCNGNLQGISALVRGKKIDDVISVLKGIDCNFRGTSCPDQLARALEEIKKEMHS